MRAASDDDTLLTEAVENGNGADLPVEAASDGPLEAPDAWESWMQQHKDAFARDLAEEFGWALGEARRADRQHCERQTRELEQRVAKLELKLAEARGALDVLRGRGVPGSFNVKGTFDPDATYSYLDVVARNGSSFVALKDGPGACPGPDWQLLASAGKRGQRGERGLRGAPAPVLSGLRFDPQSLSVTTRLSDGTLGPSLPLCLLGEISLDRSAYAICFKANDGTMLRLSVRPLFEQFYDETTKGR